MAKEKEIREKEAKEKEVREKEMKFSFRPNYQPSRRFQQLWNRNNKRRGVGGQGMRLDMKKWFKSNNIQG